jgi:hypothetical protein
MKGNGIGGTFGVYGEKTGDLCGNMKVEGNLQDIGVDGG